MTASVCVSTEYLHGTLCYMCLSGPEALWHPNQSNSQLVNQRHLKRKHRRECRERWNSQGKRFQIKVPEGEGKEKGGSVFRKVADGKFVNVLRPCVRNNRQCKLNVTVSLPFSGTTNKKRCYFVCFNAHALKENSLKENYNYFIWIRCQNNS